MSTLTDLAREEHSARMVLSIVGTANDAPTGQLLARVGAVETVALMDSGTDVPGMTPVQAALWREHAHNRMGVDTVARIIAEGEAYRFISPIDAEWPRQLEELGSRTSYGLWARGSIDLLRVEPHSMVTFDGARAATSYGEEVTRMLTSDLAYAKYTVVSGGAYGIEGAAHSGAISSGGNTIAVLASGIDRPYPSGHADLFERIESAGLIVSEVAPGGQPTRQRFLDPARVLAAFSETTVIVEAGARSGALQVANEANDLHRSVGAVPGSVLSAASNGTNMLLQQDRAHLITHASDIEDLARLGGSAALTQIFGSAPVQPAWRENQPSRTL